MSEYDDVLNGVLSSGDAANLIESLRSKLTAAEADIKRLHQIAADEAPLKEEARLSRVKLAVAEARLADMTMNWTLANQRMEKAEEEVAALRSALETVRNQTNKTARQTVIDIALSPAAEARVKELEKNARIRADFTIIDEAHTDWKVRAEALTERVAAKDAALNRARAFIGGLRGSQFQSESQHREAFETIRAIDAALSPAMEAKPEPQGCNEIDTDGTCCHTPQCQPLQERFDMAGFIQRNCDPMDMTPEDKKLYTTIVDRPAPPAPSAVREAESE